MTKASNAALGAHAKPAALCNLSLAPSKLHTAIAGLPTPGGVGTAGSVPPLATT